MLVEEPSPASRRAGSSSGHACSSLIHSVLARIVYWGPLPSRSWAIPTMDVAARPLSWAAVSAVLRARTRYPSSSHTLTELVNRTIDLIGSMTAKFVDRQR